MTDQVKEEQEIEVFIGARDLKDEVKNIMPTYDLMLKQIEQIRDTSRASAGGRHNRYNKSINNTIGIFGARGMGKSSVMFTLINHLNPPQPVQRDWPLISPNLVLDIIEPDHFGDNTKIMGSIVGLLNKTVEEQLRAIKHHVLNNPKSTEFEDYFTKGVLRPNNELKSAMNALIEYHLYTENEYRKILVHNYDDLATHIRKSEKLLTPDIEFKSRLDKLISLLVYNQRKLLEKPYIDQEPLIFLFIDDIDLKMTRSRELMESILQYANHPNIITVLSGDYTILQEAITLALIQDENLRHSNISVRFRVDEMPLNERKLKLAHEYLKKIIPPARRHNLLEWNNNTIPQFAFDKRTLMSQLVRLFGENSLFSYKKEREGKEELQPLTQSYSIFDRTPRGIVNVYYHLYEMLERYADLFQGKELGEDEGKERYNLVKALVDTMILSSTTLTAHQRIIIGEFIQWGHDESSTFVDYSSSLITSSSDSLVLSLLIIGHIIHQLLPHVRYDEAMRSQQRLESIKKLLPLKGEDRVEGKLVIHFINLIRFENALFFTHLLLEEREWLQGDIQAAFESEMRTRYLLQAVNQLTNPGREEKLLARLYQEAYVADNNNYSSSFEYLINASSSKRDFVYFKSLYEYSLGVSNWNKLNELDFIKKITLENLNQFKAHKDLIVELFINLIVQLHNPTERQSRIMEMEDKLAREPMSKNTSKLRKALKAAVEQQEELSSIEFTAVQIKQLDLIIVRFYNEIFERVNSSVVEKELRVEWGNIEAVQSAMRAFQEGRNGMNTKYGEVKWKYRQWVPESMNYADYDVLIKDIRALAINYRIWFGRWEAEQLLRVLKEQAYMSPTAFDIHSLWILENLSVYLRKVNLKVPREDKEYEMIQQQIQAKLEQAFQQAQAAVKTDLAALDLDLEDEEPTDDA